MYRSALVPFLSDPSVRVFATFSMDLPTDPTLSYLENVAGFSSYGPTADGRFKPDLMAPGEGGVGVTHGPR